GLKTGSFFYPGGNVTYQGEAVTLSRKEGVWHNYSDEQEWRANVDTVMGWFTHEDLALVTLYFGEPDSTGHKYGPESAARREMVRQVDRTVGYLRDSIARHGLSGRLDLIVTSDHGMTTVAKTAGDLVELHRFPNFTFRDIAFELLDYGPNGMLIPKEGRLEAVYGALKTAHPRLHVYKKEEFPPAFHYAGHPRITPLLMYSDLGYVIHGRVNVQFNNGEHGFDNNDMDMKTIFRAVGPSFKAGLEVEPFESVHVYALMCELLGIEPEPNDGDPGVLRPTLRSAAPLLPRRPPPLPMALLGAMVLLAKIHVALQSVGFGGPSNAGKSPEPMKPGVMAAVSTQAPDAPACRPQPLERLPPPKRPGPGLQAPGPRILGGMAPGGCSCTLDPKARAPRQLWLRVQAPAGQVEGPKLAKRIPTAEVDIPVLRSLNLPQLDSSRRCLQQQTHDDNRGWE
ncbi:PREDICTED: ectonucleotide pyrophosphatase/phosphodiesterase family member 7-like, partial [Dipodomys ordii]|uniref:Ectonucleotide pyrophosphatase/phosphodiesterase family member 7-like n=1 Tax=Dipodomys ordii TaxID=10020 RepID=A0A1S3GUN2_DIPOR